MHDRRIREEREEAARDFIRSILLRGSIESNDLLAEAEKSGFNKRDVKRARLELGAVSRPKHDASTGKRTGWEVSLNNSSVPHQSFWARHEYRRFFRTKILLVIVIALIVVLVKQNSDYYRKPAVIQAEKNQIFNDATLVRRDIVTLNGDVSKLQYYTTLIQADTSTVTRNGMIISTQPDNSTSNAALLLSMSMLGDSSKLDSDFTQLRHDERAVPEYKLHGIPTAAQVSRAEGAENNAENAYDAIITPN